MRTPLDDIITEALDLASALIKTDTKRDDPNVSKMLDLTQSLINYRLSTHTYEHGIGWVPNEVAHDG